MTAYAEDYFYLNRLVLCVFGLWPQKNKNERIQFFYKIYAIFIFVFINVYYAATEIIIFFYIYANEYDFLNHLTVVLSHLGGLVKTIFFLLQKHKLIEVMKVLESEELRYEDCEEKGFFPGGISKACKASVVKYSFLWTMVPIVYLFIMCSPLIVSSILYMSNKDGTRKLPERLPFYSWIPFEINAGVTYLIALASQAGSQFYIAGSVVGLDGLYVSLLHCVAENLVIIQGAFLTVAERTSKRLKNISSTDNLHNSENLNAAMNQEMRKICKNLQTVLKVCEDLEMVYKYVLLWQSLTTLFSFCCSLYLASKTPVGSKEFVPQFIYLVTMFVEPFMYCWFGNKVTLKADEMSSSVYQCDWVAADIKFKRSMIITMARLNKPVYLSAGGFAPLTLVTFVSLMKASYSFYTFLSNTN